MFIICIINNNRIQACGSSQTLTDAAIRFENLLHNYLAPEIVRDAMNSLNIEMSDGNIFFHHPGATFTFQMKRI